MSKRQESRSGPIIETGWSNASMFKLFFTQLKIQIQEKLEDEGPLLNSSNVLLSMGKKDRAGLQGRRPKLRRP